MKPHPLKKKRPGPFPSPTSVPILDPLDLDDFTPGELDNLQRKNVPPRESDKK